MAADDRSGPVSGLSSSPNSSVRTEGQHSATFEVLGWRLELAASPVSIVEIGASLGVPVGVARVLVSDLVNAKYLVVHLPPVSTTEDGSPAPEILERLLEGLRAR